ncbi:MAG: hypothetical protein IAE80_10915 [Anaerolinea sp.]|nr:hypothetical protein [Anaerolinea sp.]
MRLRLLPFLLLIALAACRTERGLQPEDIPTQSSVEQAMTAIPLTEYAPPAPYNRAVTTFDRVDNRLTELAGWRYIVQLEFTGVFARTPRDANASARAEVWFNQLASARRVILSTSGELIGQAESSGYEAVRLGPDAFLVRDGLCLTGAEEAAATASELSAGALVGGVTTALPAGRTAVINGEESYLFSFDPANLVLPALRAGDDGRITYTSGELWIAPARNAVTRFYLNLDVENVVIFDRQLPVTGTVLIRYDLYEAGTAFNITVPFGC